MRVGILLETPNLDVFWETVALGLHRSKSVRIGDGGVREGPPGSILRGESVSDLRLVPNWPKRCQKRTSPGKKNVDASGFLIRRKG